MLENYGLQNQANGQTTDAIDRWDDEGGTTPNLASEALVQQINKLTLSECQVLQCVGAAVVIGWNDLPTDVQRTLFTLTSTDGASDPVRDLPLRIARFLHEHKKERPAGQENRGM
jgi:hypothetical protein